MSLDGIEHLTWLTWRRIIPEVEEGGFAFNSEMAELSLSRAKEGDGIAGNERVSMVPKGKWGSPWQPFMESEHKWDLCLQEEEEGDLLFMPKT